MLILGPQRETRLNSLRLPSSIRRLTRGESIHPLLEDDCRQLVEVLQTRACPEALEVAPLWEGHSAVTGCYWKANGAPEFIRYELEYPEDYTVLGSSIHSVTTHLLAWYWTEEGVDDEELRELARLLEYPYIDQLLREIVVANREKHEQQSVWEERFRLRLQ